MSIRNAVLVLAAALSAIDAVPARAAGPAPATGAGATFPQPLYDAWGKAYGATAGTTVTYAGTGSGDGARQAAAGTVDFGGSDMPLDAPTLGKNRLVQFPSVTGGVVVVINLPGVSPGALRLDADTLAGMFRGDVKAWDARGVAALNGDAPPANVPVRVVHRSDSSGTTFVLTDYLSRASHAWSLPKGTTVNWPVGQGVDGSDSMVAAVRSTPGAIGYVEYSYAKRAGLTYVNLVNAAGRTVQPTPASFAAATATLDWTSFLASDDKSLVNRPGGASWPLTTATYVLMHPERMPGADGKPRPSRETAVRMFSWAMGRGASVAEDLDYVPLPSPAVTAVARAVAADLPSFIPSNDR